MPSTPLPLPRAPVALLPAPPRCLCRMKKEDESLTIFGVAERDQGSYTCIASTELDQDLAKAYLTVLGNCRCSYRRPPPFLPPPPPAAREAVGPGWFQGQRPWPTGLPSMVTTCL